ARQFIGDRAAVRLNGKWGFIDPSGATAVPLQYDWCGSFGEYGFDKSVAMVKNEVDKFKVPILSDCPTALIDRKGNRVTPFYGFIFPVRDKVAFVNDGRTDFADTPGCRTWASPTGNGAASIRKAVSSCRASMSWRTCS
uniref:WG repeat-containing protein n=1 Tax=Alistipes shahii TaxID=328814 RepID=UPI003FEE2EA4